MNELAYQSKLMKKIEKTFPGCFVMKNDPAKTQGIPDLLILHKSTWAMLEVKVSKTSQVQPNQKHYVNVFDNMAYCSFIYPENENEVFDALQKAFGSSR